MRQDGRTLTYAHGGRTQTVSWPAGLPAVPEVEIGGQHWVLQSDTEALELLDAQQARVRAWTATRGSQEAA